MKRLAFFVYIFFLFHTHYFLCKSEKYAPLEQQLIATIPYAKDIKPDLVTTDDMDYYNLFKNLNKKDIISAIAVDNRTDYTLVFQRANTYLYEKSNYTIRKTKGPRFFYIKPEDTIEWPANIRDLNEPEVFLYDVYVVPKQGEKAYFIGRFIFGFSCNHIVLNAIMIEKDEWSEMQKKEFDGLVASCQDIQEGYIKAYVREHHKELWTSWGTFFIDKGYKTITLGDGSTVDLRLWIYYGPDYPNKPIVMGIQKKRSNGTPCVKEGKNGIIKEEVCIVP